MSPFAARQEAARTYNKSVRRVQVNTVIKDRLLKLLVQTGPETRSPEQVIAQNKRGALIGFTILECCAVGAFFLPWATPWPNAFAMGFFLVGFQLLREAYGRLCWLGLLFHLALFGLLFLFIANLT